MNLIDDICVFIRDNRSLYIKRLTNILNTGPVLKIVAKHKIKVKFHSQFRAFMKFLVMYRLGVDYCMDSYKLSYVQTKEFKLN